jgi:hypothetical protein
MSDNMVNMNLINTHELSKDKDKILVQLQERGLVAWCSFEGLGRVQFNCMARLG